MGNIQDYYMANCARYGDAETCDRNNYFNRNRNVCPYNKHRSTHYGHRNCFDESIQCKHMTPIPAFTAEKARRQAFHERCVIREKARQKEKKEQKKADKLEKKRLKEQKKLEKKRLKEYKKQQKLEAAKPKQDPTKICNTAFPVSNKKKEPINAKAKQRYNEILYERSHYARCKNSATRRDYLP